MFKVLGVSGSLRRASVNTAILRAAADLAPAHLQVVLFEGLGDLPLFNPDLEEEPFEAVLRWREALSGCDAVLISSPEYAHGVTGVIKNALDWVVGTAEFENKPTAVLNAATRSVFAPPALKGTLQVMGAHLVEKASITLGLPSNRLTCEDIRTHPEFSRLLREVLQELEQSTLQREPLPY
ncbi:NADPH-dependent FMN reductase [Deinococcus cellulosilyticus]|uniref:NAD(P)H-dependent oxidoreductase n=1 Tax=Deinococcus cellulosilyticus (strain DSM 18568 / NBRC 106333 / KACC 11606 / 5516J-15) TaxID=1223518 RepID=A0A511N2Z8_DEIC1|nr:NADPH-dependent FMN reductase [Deinococcus cellulosilyticus]GEM46877.1 NAD(P)H-dependent oxidoreductase [Deinococcus cellulosilyticus NBRC 106333 = KACC 11606]